MRNVGHEVASNFVRAFQFGDVVKQDNRAVDLAVIASHRHRSHLKFPPANDQLALTRLAASKSVGHNSFHCRIAHTFQKRRAQRVLANLKQIAKRAIDQSQPTPAVDYQQTVLHRGKNRFLPGGALTNLMIELALMGKNIF